MTSQEIAKNLLEINAIFLRPQQPFTWASGIQSPIYCDNRLSLSDVFSRDLIEESFAKLIVEKYPECEVVVGTSTAGIAHAAITAHLLHKPMAYVRSKAKDHGRQNAIEGKILPGQKVVVIEDLISTAGSVIEVCEILREEKIEVLGIVSIFNYGMQKAIDRLKEAQVENTSLSNLDVLLEVALKENRITEQQVRQIQAFRKEPNNPKWKEVK